MPLDKESAQELKKKLKLARNKELSFALALGKKPEDCALIMHKERGGDKLLLQVKKMPGVQPKKSCYGTLTVDGQVVKLACRSDPPAGLVKNFRLFFRSNDLTMKLAVQAPGEAEFTLEAEDQAADQAAVGAENPAPGPAAGAEAAPAPGAAQDDPGGPEPALKTRSKGLQQAIAALEDGPVRAKLTEGLTLAVQSLAKGDPAKAAALLEKLEKALQQIEKSKAASAPSSDPSAPPSTPPGTPPSAESIDPQAADPDPQAARWQASFAKLDPHVQKTLTAGHGDLNKIKAVWDFAKGKASAGDFGAALKAVGPLSALLSQAAVAAKSAATEAMDAGDDSAQTGAAWDKTVALYGPVVAELQNREDPRAAKVAAAWEMALKAARGGDFDTANMIAGRLRPLLDSETTPASAQKVKPGVAAGPTSTPAPPQEKAVAPESEPEPEVAPEVPPVVPPVAEPEAAVKTAPEASPKAAPEAAPKAAPEADPLAQSTDDPVKKQALEKIDAARGGLTRIEGLIAAFGSPNPEDWATVLRQAEALLSPAPEKKAAEIEQDAKEAEGLLGDLEPKIKQLTLDKQTWDQQQPLFAARLVPIKAHALKGVDPVKTKLAEMEAEIAAAEADAARFEFKKAASGIVSFLSRGDALEALADDFAHYRKIQADRLVLVTPRRTKASPRAPIQACIDELGTTYDEGVAKAAGEDYEAAVRLMNKIPALADQVDLLLDREQETTFLLGKVNTALTKLNALPANVKALLQAGIDRCQAAYDASQPGGEPDVVKAAEKLTLARRECNDLEARGKKAKAYVDMRALFDAKLNDFKAHAGKAGIDDVIARMEAESASAASDAIMRKFDSATRILAANQGDWPAYKTRADDYLSYKTRRDVLEARLKELRKLPEAAAAIDELAICDSQLRQASTEAAARDYKSAKESVIAGDATADVAKTLIEMRAEMAKLKKDDVLAAVDTDVVAAFKNYGELEKFVAGKDDGTFATLRAAAAAEAQKGRTASMGASPDLDSVRAHLDAAIKQLEAVLQQTACKGAFDSLRSAIRPAVETELKTGSDANDSCLASDLQALTLLLTAADDAVKAPGLDFATGLEKVNAAQALVPGARKKLALYIAAGPLKTKLAASERRLIRSRDRALTYTNPIDAKESLQIEVDKVAGFRASFDTDWAAGKYAAALAKLKGDAKRGAAYEAVRADYVTAITRRQEWIYDDEVNIAGDPLVQKERDEIAAAKVKIANLLQQRAFAAASKVANDDSFAIDRGKAILAARTAYEPKRAAAEAKVQEAETEAGRVSSNAGLTAQAAALRTRYTQAHAETAVPKRRFDTARPEMEALATDCQPVIDACKRYKLFVEGSQAAATKIQAVKDHAQAQFITPLIARIEGKYANMMELAAQGHMNQAKALLDVLPQDCEDALAAAKNTAALAGISDDLDGAEEEDTAAISKAIADLRAVFDTLKWESEAEYAKGLEAAESQVDAVEEQLTADPAAAKAAIPAALKACEALQVEISHHKHLAELATRVIARITSTTAPFVKYSIIAEDADALKAAVAAALKDAQTGGDPASASTAIEAVMDQQHALMRMAARHDQLLKDCDALETQHAALLGSEHRYAIRADLERLSGEVAQARAAASKRDHDSAEAHVKTAQALAVDAVAKDKMADNKAPDPANIKKILERPDGDKQLDEMIKGLDASVQRKVLRVAFEAKYGCKLNIYAAAVDDDATRHRAGNLVADGSKKGPNIRRLYEVMSVLPPQDTRDNASMKIFGYEDVESQKGSYYGGDAKEVVMREGNASLSSVYGFGRPHEVGEVDPACEPADQDQVDFFSWNTLHEAGHAVDDQRSFMTGVAGNATYGGWQEHGGNVKPVADAIAGHYSYDADYVAQYASGNANPAQPECPADVDPEVWEQRRSKCCAHVDMARATNNPWQSAAIAAKLNIAGRVYHESYKGGSWSSYAFAARKQAISGYQFRAPGEWFSELYAAYHSKKLKDQHPAVAWLKTLV
ncbi:hypothetical protein [Pseudophaeobacter flagellatus]|uniref:hypothetical protein n=1 Tax=Pseudophaeobacter flagellatus TaxID=2899119 RepID=UPI001E45616F|nr:hypothetical protein [Pseudophaeobacter flagellatus]MCD9149764.1 hypothetical protein [Pseudophaeobacter flagellatus]